MPKVKTPIEKYLLDEQGLEETKSQLGMKTDKPVPKEKVNVIQEQPSPDSMIIETDNLKTVRNYAESISKTPAYIYKLEKEHKMDLVLIDGVKFVDTTKYSGVTRL